jgi:hypothetical protein
LLAVFLLYPPAELKANVVLFIDGRSPFVAEEKSGPSPLSKTGE